MMSGPSLAMLTIFVVLTVSAFALANDIPEPRKQTKKISGPKSLDDKIAIVGAGPSGIHMAYNLMEAGFKKVTIFESSDYIGGKARTIYHRRTPHDMGACCSYGESLEYYKLVEEFDAGELRGLPDYTVWLKDGTQQLRLTFLDYATTIAKQYDPAMSYNETLSYIAIAVQKYMILHTELFGTYEGWLMPRPTKSVLSSLNTTFLHFLKQHDIEVLQFVFTTTLASQGLGRLNETSALYGLMWITPSLLAQTFFAPPDFDCNKILSKGNQFVWQEMATQLNMKVRLSSPVKRIVRSKGSGRKFNIRYNTICGKTLEEDFDFVILSPSMKLLSGIMAFNRKESKLFDGTTNIFVTTSMVDTTNGKRRASTPRSLHVTNLHGKVGNKVVAQHDSYGLLNNFVGDNYTNGEFAGGPDRKKIQTQLYYQFARSYPNPDSLKKRLRRHIINVERADSFELKEQIVWSYFPRYSVSDMAEGVLWDILDMQGRYGIWYIGSSVSFETIPSVLQYNNLLFELYDVPSVS